MAIIPGLINAHTHLEFSTLAQPLGEPGLGFPDWILKVVGHRLQSSPLEPEQQKQVAIETGLKESQRCGVVGLGEIASAPYCLPAYEDSPGGTVFLEVLGRDPLVVDERLLALEQVVRSAGIGASWKVGISPHAPYSVHPDLFTGSIDLARRYGLSVAMHLAETKEELELMKSVNGPFVPVLEKLGAWYPETYRAGTRPLNYLRILARSPRSLIIHGNYLDEVELEFIASQQSMSVVYCPRTHHFFDHSRYPLPKMLDLGITVAVGTDSRASNPDLNLFEDLRHIARCFPELRPESILKMGTWHGAKALGLANGLGAIAVGRQAALAVVSSKGTFHGAYDFLLAEGARCESLGSAVQRLG